MTSSSPAPAPSYCAAQVRRHDRGRYLCTLLAPAACREALFALYAFDHEIARVQTIVHEPMAGLIRLQWWHDVIDGLGRGDEVAHPVVQALKRAVGDGGLNTVYLKRAIDGRRQPFEADQPFDLDACKAYLHDIGGSISSAAASLLGADEQDVLAAAHRVGRACAAFEQLRYQAMSTPDRKIWSSLSHFENRPEEIRAWAREQLVDARRQRVSIARSELSAFFPGTLAGIRLSKAVGSSEQSSLSTAVPKLILCWLRGRF